VVACRLRKNAKLRCGICERRSGRHDHGEGRHRWRALHAGTTKVLIEADAPRMRCRDHGVTVAWVPRARHGMGHTRDFDDQVAWFVTHTSKPAVVDLMHIAWRTVGAIAGRVVAEAREIRDPFDGSAGSGSTRSPTGAATSTWRPQVLDGRRRPRHRPARVGQGRPRPPTLQEFFDLLGPERAAKIRLIPADPAEWIGDCATTNCKRAVLCLDPFHILRWATQALDVVRCDRPLPPRPRRLLPGPTRPDLTHGSARRARRFHCQRAADAAVGDRSFH
jgi:transposase